MPLLQSIHHTSLTHALLYASTAPVLIAMGTFVMRKPISTGKLSLKSQFYDCAIKDLQQLCLASRQPSHAAVACPSLQPWLL